MSLATSKALWAAGRGRGFCTFTQLRYETPPGIQCPHLGSPAQQGHGPSRESPEGHRDGQRAEAPLLRRKVGRVGIVRPGDVIAALHHLKGDYKKDGDKFLLGPVVTEQVIMLQIKRGYI